MPNFMWANDHQIIDTEKITVLKGMSYSLLVTAALRS